MHAIHALVDLVERARRETPPPAVREAAVRCLLDLLAATIAGLRDSGADGVRRVAQAISGAGVSPIWFTGRTSNSVGAVWSNSAAASALDLDDGHRLARGHPGAAVIPAALAIAAETGASWDDVVRAIVVGYEVGVRVAAARRFYARTGMWSCYGVVAAVGVLRRTPPSQLAHAFAIAGMTAPNLLFSGGGPLYPAPHGSDMKEGMPWSTATATTAVLLAEAGLTGPFDILDSEAHYDRTVITDGMGAVPQICNSYFKLYSCCRHLHAPIDAFAALLKEHALDPRRINAIEVHTYSGALRISNRPRPANLVDVQFSIPYGLGLVAFAGSAAFLPLTEAALGHEDGAELAKKVTLHLDPALDAKFPAETLTRLVVFCEGRRVESPVTAPRGEASAPLSWSELEQKFTTATRLVASPDEQGEILAAVRELKAGRMANLTRVLTGMVLSH